MHVDGVEIDVGNKVTVFLPYSIGCPGEVTNEL